MQPQHSQLLSFTDNVFSFNETVSISFIFNMFANFFQKLLVSVVLFCISFELLFFSGRQFRIWIQIDILGAIVLLRNKNMAQVEEVLLGGNQIIFDRGLNRGCAFVIFDKLLNEQKDLQEHRHSIILNKADFEHRLAMTELHHMREKQGEPNDAGDQDNPVDDSAIELLTF